VFPSKRARSNRSIPDSTRSSLTQRLVTRQRERWPQLRDLQVRVRGHFAYVDGVMPDGEVWPLFRLRYGGSAHYWGFAFYTASSDSYQDSVLPTGAFEGTTEEALDCVCGLHLQDPSAWVTN
jgi:hypothetical protein